MNRYPITAVVSYKPDDVDDEDTIVSGSITLSMFTPTAFDSTAH
jgi:hypothetical protein